MSERDIAIVGLACMFPKAPDARTYWKNIVNGVDCLESVPPHRWRNLKNLHLPVGHEAALRGARGGFLAEEIPFDSRRFGIVPNAVRHGDPDQFMMLGLIDDALQDAGVAADAAVRESTDVIIGRGGYVSQKLSELFMAAEFFDMVVELLDRRFPEMFAGRHKEIEEYLRSTLSPREPDSISSAIPNIVAGLCANRLNLGGLANVVDGACASSLLAVEQAITRLRLGQCNMAVAGGQFLTQRPSMHYVFSRLGAVSLSGQIRPFDRRADGIIIGEGAGAVVLKRYEDALRDGDRVYSVIKGVGTSSDGRGRDVLAPSSTGQVKALERAYADAAVDPATIGYLEAHGTGTVVGDEAELQSILAFFGTDSAKIKTRAMGSVKSMIGHLMPAAGMASLIRTALSLSNKILPPSLHCEQPRPMLADSPFYVNTTVRPWVHDPRNPPRRAGINAFGFGGVNAHLVLEEVAPATPTKRSLKSRPFENAIHRETELLAFTAASTSDLDRQLTRLLGFLSADQSGATLGDVAWSMLAELDQSQPVKLTVVCRDFDHARELIAKVQVGLQQPQPSFPNEDAIYFSTNAAAFNGKIACLFPGQGFPGLIGNYPDHLAELCLHYEVVREQFDFLELRDLHPEDSVPTSIVFWPPEHLGPEVRAQLRQRLAPAATDADAPLMRDFAPDERYLSTIGVTLANWVSWLLVSKFNVPIDMITGQSQGEMAAVCAAGIYEFRDTVPAYWKLLNPNPLLAPNGRMCFTWISEENVTPILAQHPGTYLAICMSPEAVILGGDRNALLELVDRLRKSDHFVQMLPYPPIHTPLLSHLRDELISTLDTTQLTTNPAKIAVYSSITTEPFPSDAAGIQETLLMNVDRPLRVWQTLRRLHRDGARIFLQMGGGHMAAHLTEFLGTEEEVSAVAVDVETRSPIDQLNHFMATLFHRGVHLDLKPLFLHRRVNQIDLDTPGPAPQRSPTAIPLRLDWTPLDHPNVPAPQERFEDPTTENAAPAASPPADAPSPKIAVATPRSGSFNAASPSASEAATSGDPFAHLDDAYPLLGTLQRYEAGQELFSHRHLDLDYDLFLIDHRFVHAVEVKPIEECMPVVPMTFSIELMCEAAAALFPDLTVIGCDQVRALRWIALRCVRSIDVQVDARFVDVDESTGVHRVEVRVIFEDKVSASAFILLSSEYREDLRFEISAPVEERPWPWTAEELYSERYMFHGPRFHCITGLGNFGNPTFYGELTMLPHDQLFAGRSVPSFITDPIALDALGQLFGSWCAMLGWESLPIGVERIEFYRTPPAAGTRIPAYVEILEFDPMLRRIQCQIEAGDGEGGVWLRATGWADWLYKTPRRLKDFMRFPGRFLFADEVAVPDGAPDIICTTVAHSDVTHADSEWISYTLLTHDELGEFNQIQDDKQKLGSLASRFAVKDAVRLWLSRHESAHATGNGETDEIHPASISITHDALGRPSAVHFHDDKTMPHISLSHCDRRAVAVACDREIGIDVEPADRDTESLLPQFATAEEIAGVRTLEERLPGRNWPTRLWCAKEATGKLLGIGLAGRPKDFQLLDADESGTMIVCHEPTGSRCVVTTWILEDTIVAAACAAADWADHA